jgi:hypothetical protein
VRMYGMFQDNPYRRLLRRYIYAVGVTE